MDKPTYQSSVDALLEEHNAKTEGLSSSEVERRQEEYGLNEIEQGEKKSILSMFLDNFKDPMVIVLLIVAVVQIALGQVIESLVILAVVIVSAVISVVQERKAEESLDSLKNMSAPTAKAVRDGEVKEIESKNVVVGDIISLDVGDYIPADGRLIEANSLQVEEGPLTGESVPANKELTDFDEEVPLGDRANMVFSSTLVTNGRGRFLVTGIGNETEMGKVAKLIQTAKAKETPLQRKLGSFSKKLGWAILGLSIFIFALSAARAFINGSTDIGTQLIDSFMFAVAVAVAAIPEALQSIVTIVLSTGTNKMAEKHAIVRKLPAVETLGSASIIASDKTGTLTQNKMTVVDSYLLNRDEGLYEGNPEDWSYDEKRLMQIAVLANDSTINEEGKTGGDPTEVALIQYSNERDKEYTELQEKYPRIAELPFDSDRKLMSTLHEIDGENLMVTKGGPDVVKDLEEDTLATFVEQNEAYSSDAKRVLAFAYKPVNKEDLDLDDENDLILVGLMAMIDPPREEVYDSIQEAKNAGIRTIMITGDHKTTARAIAEDLDIFTEGDIALTGQELDKLSDEELADKLEKISVYARVTPENKIRIVNAWQDKDKVTSMTGDGVNDAPALKKADIGVAMGSGTDVAKDAAAMILTDDNFVSIVSAVEVGRNVYNNIKKSIAYLFSGNLGAVISIVFALVFNWATPFTALQLLFINLANDSFPAIALGMEPSEGHVMKQKPRDPDEGIFAGGTLQNVLFRGITIAIAVIISQYIGMQYSPEISVAMAFTTLILSRSLQVFAARSTVETAPQLGFFKNKYVVYAFLLCIALYGLTVLPGVRSIFSIPASFGLEHWGIATGLALATTIIMEVKKLILPPKEAEKVN